MWGFLFSKINLTNMKNKNIVIKSGGEIVEAEKFVQDGLGESSFLEFVSREALGKEVKGEGSDYLSIAQRLGFSWEQNSDIGFLQYDYKAALIMRLVKEYARSLVDKIGFPIYEVSGSNIFDLSHPVVQEYADLYGDRLFQFKSGKKDVVMSYDASYPQFNLAANYNLNHKHLPFGHFSISDCYRHEQSGECMLLFRQRRFYMPDLHPYFKSIEEAFVWLPKIEEHLLQSARDVCVEYNIVVEVSSLENWEKYQDQIKAIAVRLKRDILVSIIQDGKSRYWIINVDYKLMDKFGQSREICCIQIDVENAKRLNIEFQDEAGGRSNPVIIHSAVPGGIERYIYMLCDDFKKRFPLWLFPAQIRLLPVNDKMISFCQKLVEENKNLPIRFEIDDRSENISKKVKHAHNDLVPYPIVVGERELNGDLSDLKKAIKNVMNVAVDKPFIPINYSILVSQQVRMV